MSYFVHFIGWKSQHDRFISFYDAHSIENNKTRIFVESEEQKRIRQASGLSNDFNIGDNVIATYTDKLEYPAKILDITDNRSSVLVQYLADNIKKKQRYNTIRKPTGNFENEGKKLMEKANAHYAVEISNQLSFHENLIKYDAVIENKTRSGRVQSPISVPDHEDDEKSSTKKSKKSRSSSKSPTFLPDKKPKKVKKEKKNEIIIKIEEEEKD